MYLSKNEDAYVFSPGPPKRLYSLRSKGRIQSFPEPEPPAKRQKVQELNPFARLRRHYVNTQTNFRFMDLPIEIRNQIYKWMVLQRQTTAHKPSFEQSNDMSNIIGYGHGPVAEAAITRVSREVRAESLPIFYAQRRFPLTANDFPVGEGELTPSQRHPFSASKAVKMVDESKIRMMRSFAIKLLIPIHHRELTCRKTGCMLSIDLSPDGHHEMWLGMSWGDDRYMPLDKYWKSVVTRKETDVVPLMERLRVKLESMKKITTRQDLLDLVAVIEPDKASADEV